MCFIKLQFEIPIRNINDFDPAPNPVQVTNTNFVYAISFGHLFFK